MRWIYQHLSWKKLIFEQVAYNVVWQRLRKGNFGIIVVVVCYTAGEEISAMDIESNGTLQ